MNDSPQPKKEDAIRSLTLNSSTFLHLLPSGSQGAYPSAVEKDTLRYLAERSSNCLIDKQEINKDCNPNYFLLWDRRFAMDMLRLYGPYFSGLQFHSELGFNQQITVEVSLFRSVLDTRTQ